MYLNNNSSDFTQGEISATIQIWNRAVISLMDIRHALISQGDTLNNYYLPASTFLYTSGGQAEILLNETAYNVERFGLFHGCKGTKLTITPHCEWLEYYMILYKAVEPPLHRGEYLRLMKKVNPFRQQYGFIPHDPLFFSEELRKMYDKWKGPTALNIFYGKAVFYRFVHQIFEELEQGHIHIFKPDIVAMAKRYLDEHYSETIYVQELCQMLGVSYSHFHRSFKQQIGTAPQDYLIKKRLAAAKEWLETSNASVREIANHCGFVDEYSLYRLFIKNMGVAPSIYRKTSQSNMIDKSIGNITPFPYNEKSQVSLGELKEKGGTYMFKQIRNKAVVTVALSLMLMLSACSTAPANSNGPDSSSTSTVNSQVAKKEGDKSVEEGTKTISTVMGDVEVPMNPKNVLINFYTGDVLAFGITPVAIDKDSKLSYTPYANLVKDIPQVSFWNSPEDLMEWEPDVIILSGAGADGYYEKASKVAPVIICPSNMRERITLLGKVFGMEEKAEQLLQDYESKVESTKEKIKNSGFEDKTFSIVESNEDDGATVKFFYNDNGRGGEILYTDLGLNAPKKLAEEYPGSNMTVSMEVAGEYFGDYIFYSRTSNDFDYSNTDIWNSFPAVKNKNVIEFDGDAFYHHDILSTNNQLEIIQEALLKLSEK